MFRYIGCCVDWNGRPRKEIDALIDMQDNGIQITYRTFCKHVPISEVLEIGIYPFTEYYWKPGKTRELRLKDDWSVGFYRSKYRGKRVYYMKHSAIEYIFRKG